MNRTYRVVSEFGQVEQTGMSLETAARLAEQKMRTFRRRHRREVMWWVVSETTGRAVSYSIAW
jgi:hypothetical protein